MTDNSYPVLVSVIIPTFNSASYVVQAVESVFAQTYQDFEIIVVDDGSTDDTAERLKSYEGRVRYFYQENQGPSVARNRAIEQSCGPYLAFLDADDLWLPEKLAVQVAYLQANPEVGMVHADLLILEEGSGDSGPKKRIYSRCKPSGHILPELFLRNMIMTSSVLVHRSCLEVSGLFDPEFRRTQDYHLWLRIARHFSIAYLEQPLGIYRMHPPNKNRSMAKHHRDGLAAMEKFIRQSPDVVEQIGPDNVRRGLFIRTSTIAYQLFDQGSLKEAKPYFAKAIRLEPGHLSSFGYYLASYLPAGAIKRLRQLKRTSARWVKPLSRPIVQTSGPSAGRES